MKNLLSSALELILLTLATASILFAQGTSNENCSLINESRDSFFIDFERIEGKEEERNVILRFQNNSTCDIQVISSNVDHFIEKIKKPPFAQVRDTLVDSEFVPDLQFYTSIGFQSLLLVTTTPNGGDHVAGLFLKGGNSLLFSIPFENFNKSLSVVIPFEFKWETEWRSKKGAFRSGGEVQHLVWFSFYKLPVEVRKELKIK